MESRYISNKVKREVLENQNYKCARIKDYNCLLWVCYNGEFDEAGYQFDHYEEFCITGDNSSRNIQALCPNCHAVKTKRFMNNKKLFTSRELDNGSGLMDIS
jgi:heterodisulfide reductase subunit B